MPGPLLDTLKGVRQDVAPVWLMRQAGRYLPEYRELRAEKGGFLELVYDSEAAAEITVQPIRRFGFDGAILFSDILIVPHAMGQGLTFAAGEGPHLAPTLLEVELDSFTPALLTPLLDRLAAWRPTAIATEDLAGLQCDSLRRYPCRPQSSTDQRT